jgi:hypothetical protein
MQWVGYFIFQMPKRAFAGRVNQVLEGSIEMIIDWQGEYEIAPLVPGPSSNWPLKLLAHELQRLRVPVNVRRLGIPDAFPDGGWCIHQEGDVWLVYHSERGRRSGLSIFTNSFDAADFYLWRHIASPRAKSTDVGMLPRIRN